MKKVYKPEEWGISKHDQKIIELIFQLEQERKSLDSLKMKSQNVQI